MATLTLADVLDLLTTLHDEGTTLVLVTHDIAVARRLRRAIWMRDGRIVDDGPSGPVLDAFIEATAGGADAPA